MKSNQNLAISAIALAAIALLATVAMFLALADLVQGREPDLKPEWITVRLSLPVIALAQIVSIISIWILQRRFGS
jgi:hypothetical protein